MDDDNPSETQSSLEDILGMKLLLVELACEGIVQVELKSFSHAQFTAIYQCFLSSGLLKDSSLED